MNNDKYSVVSAAAEISSRKKMTTQYLQSKSKKKVGIFSFTCDEGCSIYLVEIFNRKLMKWLKAMDLVYFLSFQKERPLENLDIALIEGVISTEKDRKELKNIRKKSKVLIAMGTCTITSQPSGQRNNFSKELKEKIGQDLKAFGFLANCLLLKEVVPVDEEIIGCPIDEKRFVEAFEKYLC